MDLSLIRQAGLRLFMGAALIISTSSAARAIEDTSRILAQNERIVEKMSAFGDELKAVFTTVSGVPGEYVEHWHTAVDAALAPDLVEADFLAALEAGLSEKTRDAALAFEASPPGRQAYELMARLRSLKENPRYLDDARQYLEAASREQNARLVDLFEFQQGPLRARQVVDAYLSAVKTAAQPVIGAHAAEQWVDGAQDRRDGYIEDTFLDTVATFSQLPEHQLQELVDAIGTPEMLDYARVSAAAFGQTLNAALDRLEKDLCGGTGDNRFFVNC